MLGATSPFVGHLRRERIKAIIAAAFRITIAACACAAAIGTFSPVNEGSPDNVIGKK